MWKAGAVGDQLLAVDARFFATDGEQRAHLGWGGRRKNLAQVGRHGNNLVGQYPDRGDPSGQGMLERQAHGPT